MNAAVFLDKDGTLIHDVPYNVDPARIRLAPHAGAALARLRERGYRLVVVSNQSGVALGRFPASALEGVARRLTELLAPHGAAPDAFYWCPHAPGAGCGCRKPQAGLLQAAARDHGLALARSWMVGDILHDIEAGHRAGCRAVLIDNGNETEWDLSGPRRPDHRAADLAEAAELICGADAPVRAVLDAGPGRLPGASLDPTGGRAPGVRTDERIDERPDVRLDVHVDERPGERTDASAPDHAMPAAGALA